jgi:DMSO/TMAO reductase YedYZ heme-binding membrane subunit
LTYRTDHSTPSSSSGPSPAYPPGRGARVRSLLRRFSLRWLTTIIVLANAAYAGLITVQFLAGAYRHATADTGLYGTILLVLTLVPANLLRFGWFKRRKPVRFLAGLRKPLGISAGVWFAAHTIVGIVEYFDLSLSSELVRQFLIGDMLAGVVAMLVFVALLATSFSALQRRLGKSWKPLQRLVWFAVPLALVHTILSATRLHHFEMTPVWFLGAIVAFAAFEYFASGRRGRGARGREGGWTHAGLIIAGTVTAVLIYAASWVAVGPWDFAGEMPGPPPGLIVNLTGG